MNSFLHRIVFAFKSIANRKKFETDLNEEITDFLERDARNRMAQGETRVEAERAARVNLQGVQQTRERVRELQPGIWFETLWHDVRFAGRLLSKRPGYVAAAFITIALGIGACTTIFSLIHAVLIQPLPFHDPERLVLLQTKTREGVMPQVAHLDFEDVRNQHPAIEQATLFLYDAFVVEQRMRDGGSQPMRRFGLRVTQPFFETLGAQPFLGRTFHSNEMLSGNDHVAVISHRLWKELYHLRKEVLGAQIKMNEQAYVIVGVMPANFDFFLPMTDSFVIQDIDVYVPFPGPPEYALHRSVFMFEAIARLKKNVTQSRAEADLAQISQRLAREYPDTNGDRLLLLTALREHMIGSARPALYLLTAAVLLVLLVACANLANLMIGRVTAREQELAVCAALGASRHRMIRRLVVESTLMVALGGIAGILLASLLLPYVTMRLASQLPAIASMKLNVPVLIFASATCLVTGLISGLLPARLLWRGNVNLHAEGRSTARGGRARLRKGIVVTEIALSSVLLTGAILLGSSFLSLMRVQTGFDSGKLLTFQIRLSESRYETRKQVAQTMSRLTEKIAELHGVERATVTSSLPFSGHNTGTAVWIEGRMPPPGKQPPEARWQFVQPGYFETMRIPLLRGRLFNVGDPDRKQHLTLISESVARRDFPGEDPVGKRVSYGPPGGDTDWHEIIGVVGDVRHGTLREQPAPRVYDLLGQHADLSLFVTVRTDQPASQIMRSVRTILSGIDPGAPVYDVQTMKQYMADSAGREQILATIVVLFAVAALLLGAAGAYGVISSLVAQRTREIGIRMALGAAPKSILRSTIREGLQLVCAGLAAGLVIAFGLGPLLRGLLFGVEYADPRTFAIVAATLLLVSLAACYIPARRASRVNPVIALHQG